MLLIFKCAYFSGILLRVVHSAPSTEYVVYPRLLDERGLDVERILYIQDDIVLRLQKNTVLGERFTFSETVNGTREDTIMDGRKLEANMFHDRIRMASVKVEDKNGAVEVRGILSNRLRITPLHISARSNDGLIPHKIYQVDQRAEDANSFKADLMKKDSESVFEAELNIVVDSYYWSHFKGKSELIEYLAICMQLVNIRYEDTKDPMVQFLLTAVEQDAASVFYTIDGKDVDCSSCPSKLYVDADGTLQQAKSIYGHNKEHDITVLVTSLDIVEKNGGSILNTILGYAERRGLCSEGSRVALVEDAPHSYSLTRIITHELGHTLGATHDGVEHNDCSLHDGYIMAPFTHGSNNGHFSDCSIKEIQEFVKTIKEDCREVKSRNTLNKNGTPVLPGVVMNLTRYCELKHPSFCDITVNQDKIKECRFQCCFGGRVKCMKNKPADPTSCNNQWDINMDPLCSVKCCSLFASDATHKCFEEIAVDGTPCDDKKMCFRNKCVDNYDLSETPGLSTAPATEES
ncbi:venom metalloproteinase antarease-like TtrivMP_A [Ixodes scapularis]|uniref:venom metalloproteinase antarease-like TtrivMP_A n=1 Tax=Ixodes scapularis TaxID=6945 RepID=UPI001A9DED0E|nr:venom metalloproteinase antarease-like TtrivMP_A [Ixodes scapularis]